MLSGCASRVPLHRQLKTADITVGVHAQKNNHGYSNWDKLAAGKVAESLQSQGLVDQIWESTTDMFAADTYALTLVNRDKIDQIMAEKSKQYEQGGISQISDKLQDIRGLNVLIFTSVNDISTTENKFNEESYLLGGTSSCRTLSAYSILHVEVVRVDNGQVVITGEYEGNSSITRCKADNYPGRGSFNQQRLKLKSLSSAASKFSEEFKNIL